MKNINMKKGFTMIELVMVIVVIGILSAVALPKLMGTRGIALDTKAKATLYSVRGALSTEMQNRFMNGDDTAITTLGTGTFAFDKFSGDVDSVTNKVFDYPLKSCTNPGCWSANGTVFTYYLGDSSGTCTYNLANNLLSVQGTCTQLGD